MSDTTVPAAYRGYLFPPEQSISESRLVQEFVWSLKGPEAPWDTAQIVCEFFYRSGRANVVVLTGSREIVAFEAKLLRWRDAMHQAYRNRCFAHQSYVALPRKAAQLAHEHVTEFHRRGVGICYVEQGRVVVLHESPRRDPLLPWLSERVVEQLHV